MSGHVCHRRRLGRRIRGKAGGAAQVAGGGVGVARRIARSKHLDLTAHPCPGLLDRMPWPRVQWPHSLEQVQDVLRACGCPQGQKPMVVVGERAAAADRDEPSVANLREDHPRMIGSLGTWVITSGAPSVTIEVSPSDIVSPVSRSLRIMWVKKTMLGCRVRGLSR